MKCRKCKELLNLGDFEVYVSHLKETHGVPFERAEMEFKRKCNKERLKKIYSKHKETGRKSIYRFYRKRGFEQNEK